MRENNWVQDELAGAFDANQDADKGSINKARSTPSEYF